MSQADNHTLAEEQAYQKEKDNNDVLPWMP